MAGRFWADNALFDVYGPVLGPVPIAVYGYLARRADNQTRSCYPSYSDIASTVGISRGAAIRAIHSLCRVGLIKKEDRGSKSGGAGANLYLLPTLSDRSQVVLHEDSPWCSTGTRGVLHDDQGSAQEEPGESSTGTGVVLHDDPEGYSVKGTQEGDSRKGTQGASAEHEIPSHTRAQEHDSPGAVPLPEDPGPEPPPRVRPKPKHGIPEALFDYFQRLPLSDEVQEVLSSVECYARSGRSVQADDLRQAVQDAREWWTANRNGNPRTIRPFLNALADIVNPVPRRPRAEPPPRWGRPPETCEEQVERVMAGLRARREASAG